MESVLSPTTTTTTSGTPPFVKMVDISYDPSNPDCTENNFPGYFKVAIASLVTEFYPHFGSKALRPHEIWSQYGEEVVRDIYRTERPEVRRQGYFQTLLASFRQSDKGEGDDGDESDGSDEDQ